MNKWKPIEKVGTICPGCNLPAGQIVLSKSSMWYAMYDGKKCSKTGCAVCGREEGRK